MTAAPPAVAPTAPTDVTPRQVWSLLSDLVLDNVRRREVSEALGMSFGRVRAIRRLAHRPMSMGELAGALGIDPPYATVVVDDLESLGLVRRRPHATDRRAKLVEATRKGKEAARRADGILGTPPPGLSRLEPEDLRTLGRILEGIAGEHELESDAAAGPRRGGAGGRRRGRGTGHATDT